MKKVIRVFVLNILIFSLIANSTASESKVVSMDENLQFVVDKINSSKNILEEIRTLYKNMPGETKELEIVLKENPDLKKIRLPKITLENGKISFTIKRKKAHFTLVNNRVSVIDFEGKSLIIDPLWSMHELFKKLSTEFDSAKKFSLLNFFIQDTYAQAYGIAMIFLMMGIISIYVAALSFGSAYQLKSFNDLVKSNNEFCKNLQTINFSESEFTQLKDMYNSLADNNLNFCKNIVETPPRGCLQIDEVKNCLKNKIVEYKTQAINNSSPSIKKIIEYDSAKDQFSTVDQENSSK
jgi:hypothetical protein